MIFQPWVGQFGSEGGSNFTLWDSREPKGTVVLGNKSFCYFAVLQIKISRKEQFSYTGPYLFCDNLQKFQAQHHVLFLHTLMYLLRQNFLFPAILYYLQNSFDPKFESISYFSQVGNHVYVAKGSGGGVITMKNADRTFFDPRLQGMVGTVISHSRMVFSNTEQIFHFGKGIDFSYTMDNKRGLQ